ncbi:hypothetical protein FEMY_21810 [Ferrovum myxofaciens]|uniref:Uncharacterized protein n=1 Tax=Ferrovum myxofaciens TaxID=416213 RepID=A0A149VVP9_9PROT|nr:hypothetical protein FEMY_21810 [Ferrovum myxofaciens]
MNLDYVTVTINITPPLADLTSNFKLLLLAQFQVADDTLTHFHARWVISNFDQKRYTA